MKIRQHSSKLAIHRYPTTQKLHDLILEADFWSLTKTSEEISLIVPMDLQVPSPMKSELDWVSFQVEGVLDFSLVGIIARLTTILATNGISVFVVSTFDTDYILIKEHQATKAIECWNSLEGVHVVGSQ
jgi:hypothetical protein